MPSAPSIKSHKSRRVSRAVISRDGSSIRTHGTFMGRLLLGPISTFLNKIQAAFPENSCVRNNDCVHVFKVSWIMMPILVIIFVQLGMTGRAIECNNSELCDRSVIVQMMKSLDDLNNIIGKNLRYALAHTASSSASSTGDVEAARTKNQWTRAYNNTIKEQMIELQPWPFPTSANIAEFTGDVDKWLSELDGHHNQLSHNSPVAEFNYFSSLSTLTYNALGYFMKNILNSGAKWPDLTTFYFYLSTKYRVAFQNNAVPLFGVNKAKPAILNGRFKRVASAKMLRVAQIFADAQSDDDDDNKERDQHVLEDVHASFLSSVEIYRKLDGDDNNKRSDAITIVDDAYMAWSDFASRIAKKFGKRFSQRNDQKMEQIEKIMLLDIIVTVVAVFFCIVAYLAAWGVSNYFIKTDRNNRDLQRRADEYVVIVRQHADFGALAKPPMKPSIVAIPEVHEDMAALAVCVKSFIEFVSDALPSKAVNLLNKIHSSFEKTVKMYDCYKVETTGEYFLAVNSTAAKRRVDSPLALALIAVETMESTREITTENNVALRMGLHCGPCFACCVGTSKLHYEYFGLAVAVAVQLTKQNTTATILMSDKAKERLTQASGFLFTFQHYGTVVVVDDIFSAFALVNAEAVSTPTPLISSRMV